MINIKNTCLVCGAKNTFKFKDGAFEFKDNDLGSDIPDGPWTVPCEDCQSKIISQLTAELTDDVDEDVAYHHDRCIVMECQRGNADVIAAVRENRLQAWLDANMDYPFYLDMNKHHYYLLARFYDKAKPKKSDDFWDKTEAPKHLGCRC